MDTRSAIVAGCLLLSGLLAWHLGAKPDPGGRAGPVAEIDPDRLEELAALGYTEAVTQTTPGATDGVTVFDRRRALPGTNIWCSVGNRDVHFTSLEGRTVRGLRLPQPVESLGCLVEPTPDGGFITLTSPHLTKWNRDLEMEWVSEDTYHHDVFVDAGGTIYTLTEQPGSIEYRGRELPIRDHSIVILESDGRVRDEIPLAPVLRGAIRQRRLQRLLDLELRGDEEARRQQTVVGDVFHVNGIHVLDRDLGPARRGDALICARELNQLLILDLDARRVVWRWGRGQLDSPHHPTLLPDGSILLFDNGRHRGWSRLLKVDPRGSHIRWEWRANPRDSFYSDVRGSVQPLANGHLLVTESTRGRVFELDREGSIVWEFYNPERVEPGGARRQIYRMLRVPPVW